MFHCLSPSPCFLYGWPAMQATEAVMNAVSKAMPDRVVACSGGDLCALVWYGFREKTGEFWGDGSPHPVGQGASAHGDGASSLLHMIEAATRFSPSEVWEARNPWLMESLGSRPTRAAPGSSAAGSARTCSSTSLEDAACTSTVERTKNAPGTRQRAARARERLRPPPPDGTRLPIAKAT